MRTGPITGCLAAALFVGCAAAPPKKSPAKPADPPGTLRSKDGGVSLVMPRDWIAVDANSPGFKALAAKLGKANPQVSRFVQQSSGALLLAICATQAQAKADMVDTVSVKSSPSNGKTGFTDFEIQQLQREYAKSMDVDGKVGMEPVQFAAGAGLQYSARVRIRRPGNRPVIVQNMGYLLFHGGNSYAITFTTTPERATAMALIAGRAAKSFRVR